MRAGRLRHRVEVYNRIMVKGRRGHREPNWVKVATRRAEVTPLTGRPLMIAQQSNSEITHRTRMRDEGLSALSGLLKPESRLKWLDPAVPPTLEVSSVIPVEGRGRELVVMCKEIVGKGGL